MISPFFTIMGSFILSTDNKDQDPAASKGVDSVIYVIFFEKVELLKSSTSCSLFFLLFV